MAGATRQIADLGDLEGGVPGAPVCWERRHPAGFRQATEDQAGEESS
ncbi:MAG: hypothetical protein [Olavius algarvensis Gamma 1 endosymbiont]|nr:MAG: hypothetical protein [Olavius algarvensis Gamma 1 endosymbiont]